MNKIIFFAVILISNLFGALESRLDIANLAQLHKSLIVFKDKASSKETYSEFIISYKAIVKDNVLLGEEFNVAKALTFSEDYEVLGICDLENIGENFKNDSAKVTFLKQNKEAILECLQTHTQGKISDSTKFIDNQTRTTTTFKIPPQRVLLYKDSFKLHIIGTK